MRSLAPTLLLATALTTVSPALADAPHVVATIKPIHSLVAAVMGERGTPDLIVTGASSPHDYSLKPSNAAALQNADLVFWTGPSIETFLADSISTVAADATIVELDDTPGLTLLPPREAGTFEPHEHDHHDHDHDADEDHDDDHDHDHDDDHDHDHQHADHDDDHDHDHDDDHDHDHDGDHDHEAEHDHDHEAAHEHDHGEEQDLHFFLDPENAVLMTREIADALAAADPEGAAIYQANAEAEIADLEALTTEIAEKLTSVGDRPFVVFHDAYQYFEHRFGLNVAGSVTVSPEVTPGADRIATIRAKLTDLEAACVFAEPQFESRIVEVLVEGTGAHTGVLDPIGANLTPGPELYRELITGLADGLIDCLVQ